MSVSSVSDVAEVHTGWPLGDEFLEGAQSPRVDLADVVARLQKEVEDLRVRLVGTNIVKCLRPFLVPVGGTV